MALHFEQVSLASLPANLVAAPAVAPVMWLGMRVDRGSRQVAPALCAPLNALNGSLLALPGVGRARRGAAARGRAAACGSAARPASSPRTRRWSGGCSRWPARAWPAGPARGGGWRCRRTLGGRVPLAVLALVVDRTRGPRRRRARASSWSRSSTSARATRRCCSARRRACWSTPGRPAARSCARLRRGRRAAARRARAHARRGRPRGHGAAVVRALRPRLVLDGGAGWPTRVAARAARRARARGRRARAGQELSVGAAAPAAAVAAAAGARLAARRQPQRPRGGRAGAAPARSTCCCRPTRSPTSPARSSCPASRRSRWPTTAATTRACRRCCAPHPAAVRRDRGRPRTTRYGHPTPSTLAALRARCRRWCARTATAPCGCMSSGARVRVER